MITIDDDSAPSLFDKLVRDEYAGLLRFAYLLCGDSHRAEDAVANALATTWPRWRGGGVNDPRAYIRRAIVNEFRGWARRSAVRQRFLDHRRVETTGRAFDDNSVERDEIHAALLRLPLRQRAVIVLRFYDDLTEQQIADALRISAGTVKTHIHRALHQLRATLEETE